MPGVFRHPLAELPRVGEEALKAGLGGVILFGVLPQEAKDPWGGGPTPRAGWCSGPSGSSSGSSPSFWSWPTPASASTPTTATAGW